MKKSWFYQS